MWFSENSNFLLGAIIWYFIFHTRTLSWVEVEWKEADTRDKEAAARRARETLAAEMVDRQPDDGLADPQPPPRRYPARETKLRHSTRTTHVTENHQYADSSARRVVFYLICLVGEDSSPRRCESSPQ